MVSENTVPVRQPATGDLQLVIRRQERVLGELPVQDHHCDAQGRASIATLFAIADALSLAGIVARYGPDAPLALHEAKTIALRPARTNLLTGEALPLPAPDGLCAWQTTIRSEDGETVAILVQGYVMGKTQLPVAQPLEPVVRTATHRPVPLNVLPVDGRIAALIAAGTEVIARKGFANATIREIAEQAGVHIPTFYQHIASKDDLLELVYAREMKALEDDLEGVRHMEGTARDRLEKMIWAAIETSHHRQRQIGILNRELKSLRPEARTRVIAQYRRLIGRYEAVIRDGIRNGEFADIDPVVTANVMDMISDMWALRPFFFADHSLDAYKVAATAFVLNGLGTPQRTG